MLFYILLLIFGCSTSKITVQNKSYTSETLVIQKLSDHVYQHISFLQTQSFGKVPCNGMIVVDNGEAIIFDTPTDNAASLELINWVESNLKCTIKAIIPTHFHADCLAGLDVFHKHKVPSYAFQSTITLATLNNSSIPENGFDSHLELQVGKKKVVAEFVGQGHTKDNIIGYFPDEETIFGGCLIKELGAGKGYLEDANITDWSLTVTKLKQKYPNTKTVIPGHGKIGGIELFAYTINLFK